MKKRITALVLGLCLVVLPTTGCSIAKRMTGSDARKEAIEKQQDELKKQAEELQKKKAELEKKTDELKKQLEEKKTKAEDNAESKTKSEAKSETKSETKSKVSEKSGSSTAKQTDAKAANLEAYMEMVPGVKEGLSGMMASLQNEQMGFSMEIKENTIRMILTMKMEMDNTMSEAMKSGLETSFKAQQSSLKTQLANLSKQSGLTGLAYEIQVLKQDGSELLKMVIEQD
ncbi:MAG: hypothetical protein Q4D52_01250 [Eubacteriales bacterium]|nr:hypothetical protein [Eubacteriales bacterium]